MGSVAEVPTDWYRRGFPPITAAMPWADRTEAEVDRAIMMLRPEGGERVLDLACGIGRHSLELRRRGFEVVGVDISPDLLAMAEQNAGEAALEVTFMQADLRELELAEEFDLVLSLNDGAVGYFETDAENRRTFEVIARALRAGGGHLVQLPNVLHAEKNLPAKTWIVGESTLELSDHHWNAEDRYIEGSTVPIPFGEVFERYEEIPFRQRLYTAEELAEIYESVGMRLANTFAGSGKARKPKPNQFEIFVEGRKDSGNS
ncbi:MAG TPA: class I SAM-dependent methyltransferase [Solirubrobacterales bacterium]|nr:class I SAM-dependent methyltransferase [Solirubrobacterales bacterium]